MWIKPSVDGAVKHLTKALDMLEKAAEYHKMEVDRYNDEISTLHLYMDKSAKDHNRAQRIHTKLAELLQ